MLDYVKLVNFVVGVRYSSCCDLIQNGFRAADYEVCCYVLILLLDLVSLSLSLSSFFLVKYW